MYSFKKNYAFSTQRSFLNNPRGFAFWLYRYYERILNASANDAISSKEFRNGLFDIVERAASLPGRDRFICDIYECNTKAQMLERCEIAIENARARRVA